MSIKFLRTVLLLLTCGLANVPARSQQFTFTAVSPSLNLPHKAARALSRHRSRAARLRLAYLAAQAAENRRVDRELRRELHAASKRGDSAGASAVIASLKELHMVILPMAVTPARPIAVNAEKQQDLFDKEAEQELLGKWSVRCGPNFQSVWSFQRDGTVLSTNGAHKGTWQWDQQNRRILIRWNETEWDSLNLPLNEKEASGATFHPEGWRVVAVKLL